MEELNILFANIYDKEEINNLSWNCCSEHKLNIEFALNLDDLITKLQSGKKYHGLILGNRPENAKFPGLGILEKVRELNGFERIPAIILFRGNEEIPHVHPDTENVLFVPFKELQGNITMIMHEHFLGLNQ